MLQTSRAQVLKHATEYIQFMNKKNGSIQKDIDSMKRQNQYLKQQGDSFCHSSLYAHVSSIIHVYNVHTIQDDTEKTGL